MLISVSRIAPGPWLRRLTVCVVVPAAPIAWVPKSCVSVLPTQVTTGTTAALPRPTTVSVDGTPAALCATASVAR